MFEYRARCVNVVDGDTQDVVVDLGFRIERQIRLRLLGVDTHETYGVSHGSEEYQRGLAETEYVAQWFGTAESEWDGEWPLKIQTEKRGKYGRYLATIARRCDGAELTADLLAEFDDIEN